MPPTVEPTGAADQLDADGKSLEEKFGAEAAEYIKQLRDEAAGYRVKAKSFESLGTTEELEAAKRLWDATKTEDGLKTIFNEAASELGYDVSNLTEAQAKEVAAVVDEASDKFSREDIEKLIDQKVSEPIEKLRSETLEQQFAESANAALDALNVTDPQDRFDVLTYSNEFMREDTKPSDLKQVIQQGYDKWGQRLEAFGELAVSKYLESKAQTADQQPNALTGNQPVTGVQQDEPKNTREVVQRLREKLGEETVSA